MDNLYCLKIVKHQILSVLPGILFQFQLLTPERVGTAEGSKSSQCFGSMGTQTRPEKKKEIVKTC